MPIPKRSKGESEKEFIPRCISEIIEEYDQEGQAAAICYQQMSISLIGDKEYRRGLTKSNILVDSLKKEMKRK